MKKIIYLFLLVSVFVLSSCKPTNNPDNPGDNLTNPGDNNVTPPTGDLSNLEEYYNTMKSKYNQYNDRDVHVVYYDEDTFIFRNNMYMFYEYKDGVLTEHDILLGSNSTPGILRYIKETSTLYYVDASYYIYVEPSERILINTYNFETESRGSFTSVDTIHALTHDHFITENEDNVTVYDSSMNIIKTYDDGLFLGYTSHPSSIDKSYSLVAKKTGDVCSVDVYLDELVKTIPLSMECNYVYNMYSRTEGMHFLLGDSYTESNLYYFDSSTIELTKVNTYDSGIKYVIEEDTNVNRGIYAFRLANDTSVVYNTTFTENQSYVYTTEDILLIGQSFYVTKPGDDYVLHDLNTGETSDINSIFLSTSNYSITDDYFIGMIYDGGNTFLYLQKIFNKDGDVILENVLDFRVLNFSNAIYIDKMTDSSYEVKMYSFATEQSRTLHTHTFTGGQPIRFIEYHVDTENNVYVIADDNLSVKMFTQEGIEQDTYKLLGSRNYKGYRMLYIINEEGQLEEVLIS